MKIEEEYTLTKTHYDKFKKYVIQYAQKLQLGYRISVFIDDEVESDEGEEGYACANADVQNGIASIFLNKKWSVIRPTDENLKMVAIHECLEVLMFPIRDKLSVLFSWNVADKAIHDVIRRLENLI